MACLLAIASTLLVQRKRRAHLDDLVHRVPHYHLDVVALARHPHVHLTKLAKQV